MTFSPVFRCFQVDRAHGVAMKAWGKVPSNPRVVTTPMRFCTGLKSQSVKPASSM